MLVFRIVFFSICRGNQYLVSVQNIGNPIDSIPFQNQLENAPDNCRRFRVYNQMLLVVRVTPVAVGDTGRNPLPFLHTGFKDSLYLAAGIACIPFIHNVQKRREIAVLLVAAVYAVVDCYEPDAFFFKHDFGVKPYFQIVAPEPAHIFYDNDRHVPGFHFGNHGLEALPVECRPTHSVVDEVAYIDKAVLPCVVL